MTPDEMRSRYRERCYYARKGHVVFNAKNGVVKDVFETFSSNNAAKRWVGAFARTKTFVV